MKSVPLVSFLEHVGERPSDRHELERMDSTRGWGPGNVRWATKGERTARRAAGKGIAFDAARPPRGTSMVPHPGDPPPLNLRLPPGMWSWRGIVRPRNEPLAPRTLDPSRIVRGAK